MADGQGGRDESRGNNGHHGNGEEDRGKDGEDRGGGHGGGGAGAADVHGAADTGSDEARLEAFFAHVLELEERVRQQAEEIKLKEEQLENRTRQLQRLQADFNNFRRRTEEERGRLERQAVGRVIAGLLPVLDTLERAAAAEPPGDAGAGSPAGPSAAPGGGAAADPADGAGAGPGGGGPGTTAADPFRSGLEIVRRQFDDFLAGQSVEKIPTVGHPFDPNWHEAIHQIETDEVPHNYVALEIRPGYRLGDQILSPALVQVAHNPGGQVDGSTKKQEADGNG